MAVASFLAAPADTARDLARQVAGSDWLWRIAVALAIALVGLWLARMLSKGLDRVMLRAGLDLILRDFLRNLAYVIGLVVVLVAALDALGVPTTSMLAVLGAAGLAIGLALKDSLSNIASGVMLIVLRPFRAGDAVQIAGQEGVVERVGIFQTVLRAYQNHDITLPNSEVTTSPIVNFTSRGERRVDVTVGVGYGDDLARARSVLLGIARANARVLEAPETDVLVTGLGESSIGLVLRAWVKTPDFVLARSELTEAIHRDFAKAGVSIPFPQRDLHVYHHDADGRPLAQVTAAVEDPDRG
ncbi:mechanosensitive ion channel family protein [Arenimonas sp.]|uniref:mechanosensitive ion channel family protein n=1 Tax=Arenimonas sp. TaxID=1872635 RepID=UPI002E339BCD|nr:mechanosensitive ion channel domain-containing protein [Arenimonas sp.]HEX4853613.1 mechanosensitive ion channel domain-containing protein [Arenimonas sp.]